MCVEVTYSRHPNSQMGYLGKGVEQFWAQSSTSVNLLRVSLGTSEQPIKSLIRTIHIQSRHWLRNNACKCTEVRIC
jgi:hypothetical protein